MDGVLDLVIETPVTAVAETAVRVLLRVGLRRQGIRDARGHYRRGSALWLAWEADA